MPNGQMRGTRVASANHAWSRKARLVVIGIQTVRVQGALEKRRKATQTLAFVCFLGCALWIPVALPDWNAWTTPLLMVVPGLLTIVVMRFSVISAAYLLQVTVNFGVTSLILGSQWQPALVSAVLVWSLAIAVGTLLGGPASSRRTSAISMSWLEPRWPHYMLSAALIGVSLFLTLAQDSGYAAQIMNGTSTPTGILGTLSAAAPIFTLALLLSCLGSDGSSAGAIGLAGVQIFVLALSGFRGAAATFILAILVGAALTLPRGSSWRRRSRLLVILPIVLILTISTIVIGANVKNSAANILGVSSSGTKLSTLDGALENVTTRFQLASSLDMAVEHRNDATAIEAVSWTTQIQAVVPRFLWQDKPIVDYGQRVSAAIYGPAYGKSSSTVTTIGDGLLNFGLAGLLFIGLLAGYFFRWVAQRINGGAGALSILMAAVAVQSAIGQEQPIILLLIGILRNGLLVGGLWVAATLIVRRRHPVVRTR